VTESVPPWDPEVLARIKVLHLRARQLVAGASHGGHASVRVTSNVEFADYKEYSPGDPLRDLDWRVQARTDRLVVRRHRAETEMPVTFLVDASGDLATGEGFRSGRRLRPALEGTKWGYAAVLTATLAWWLHRRGEPVGLMVAGGTGVRWPWLPPRGGIQHLTRIFGVLADLTPSGEANLGRSLTELGARLPRRSMLVLVSDLMEEPAAWGPPLSGILARQVDIRVAHLHDAREWRLDYGSGLRFRSPEGGEALAIDPDDVRPAFEAVLAEYLAEVRAWLGSARSHHVLAPTDQAMDRVLAGLLRGA
jgi:uncharacterized protein (DUF58 family)